MGGVANHFPRRTWRRLHVIDGEKPAHGVGPKHGVFTQMLGITGDSRSYEEIVVQFRLVDVTHIGGGGEGRQFQFGKARRDGSAQISNAAMRNFANVLSVSADSEHETPSVESTALSTLSAVLHRFLLLLFILDDRETRNSLHFLVALETGVWRQHFDEIDRERPDTAVFLLPGPPSRIAGSLDKEHQFPFRQRDVAVLLSGIREDYLSPYHFVRSKQTGENGIDEKECFSVWKSL